MEHDLVAAAMRFPGSLRGTGMIGENGEGQGIVKRKDGIDSGGITGDVVENDGQTRAWSGGLGRVRSWAGFG